jgi:hypothetical protein
LLSAALEESNMKSRSIITLAIGASLLLVRQAHAQDLEQSLFPPNLALAVRYGSGIAVDDNTLVVVDRGYQSPASTACSIDDGAVHIYRRSSWTAPWPSTPNQTIVAATREGHFGEHIVLRGNTLLIAESRWTDNPNPQIRRGAIHYYTRPNATSNFSFVETQARPVSHYFTLPGLASNNRYVVSFLDEGPEPSGYVYTLSPSGLVPLRPFNNLGARHINQGDGVALTDNDVIIITLKDQPTIQLYGVNNNTIFPINSSALTLTNGPGEADHVYTGQIDIRGTDVVVATKRRSTAAPPNDDTTYALRVFSLAGRVVTPVGEAEIPSDYNLADGYSVTPKGLEIARGRSVLVNLAGATQTLHTLGFEYSSGQFDLALEMDQADYYADAGVGRSENYVQPVAFDGQYLYVGDIYGHPDQNMCSHRPGSVRIFDTGFGGNPSTVCAGEQNVYVKFDPIPGATSFQWWGNGSTISGNGFSAQVDYSINAAQPSVTLGVNLNQPPWWTTRTHTATAEACGVAETYIDTPEWACKGAQDHPVYTPPIAGATAYNWTSPGATNITSTGNTALIDFATNVGPTTTVQVGIQLGVPPYFTQRTAVVNTYNCIPFP